MRDLMNKLHFKPAFAPGAAVTDDTAIVSSVCDRSGYESVVLAYIVGTNADANMTSALLIEDSADNSTFAAVADADLNGTETLGAFNYADDGECRKIGYTGGKQYVRATITPSGNTGNQYLGGMWVLGDAALSPTPNPPA